MGKTRNYKLKNKPVIVYSANQTEQGATSQERSTPVA